MLSTPPDRVDGRLAPRHVDLRPFVFLGRATATCARCRAGSRASPSTRARWWSTRRRTAAPRTRGCCRDAGAADRRHDLRGAARRALGPAARGRAAAARDGARHGLHARDRGAGGLPVVLPPLATDAIEPLLDRLDGVCLSGGPDIDPDGYGAEPQPAARPDRARPRRASSSRSPGAPTRAGCRSSAICRGAQALNVARGGTLHQHLPEVTDGRSTTARRRRARSRPTRCGSSPARGSRASLGADRGSRSTPSTTRRRPARRGAARGRRGRPTGSSRRSRTPAPALLLGVQWHAEALVDRPEQLALFRALRRGRARRDAPAARGAGGMTRPRRAGTGRTGARAGTSAPYTVGDRGGGDAARARTAGRSHPRSTSVLAALARELRRRTSRAETHGSALELATGVARRRRRRGRRAARRCAASSPSVLEPLGLRAAVRGHAPVRASGRTIDGLAPARATSSSTARCASSPGASRPSRCTCTSACPTPRTRSARANRHARAPAAAARAVGQLAVLAGPRHRPGLGAHAALPGLPARRASRAPFARLRRLRRGGRPADPLRRDPRADVPVVGRAPAAALRHGRGADHGRADDASPTPPRSPRSCSASCALEVERGLGRHERSSTRPRCSTRTASSPRATAWTRS